jgi:site-specific DNA recombinase
MNKKQGDIKHVAIYLRKSRDEGEYDDVLSKHRDTLLAIATAQNWTYRLYEEIGSGESIAKRNKMQQLLTHVDEGYYDGVLVMDIDRLGRGEHADWAKICEAFLYPETYVITPQKIYDLSEEQDEMFFDFQAIFAKMEYKIIKKRMKQGKVAGAKKGMWTNGRPPYPYVYISATKQVEVDEEKRKIYRLIIEKFLSGISAQKIAEWLNQSKIAPPYVGHRNKHGWSNNSVLRLLTSETHLGYVIYGKTRNLRGTVKLVEEEDWIKVKGTHEPLKTAEEHELILVKIARNNIIPKKTRNGMLPLSGLLYCAKCGRAMQYRRFVGKKETYWNAVCVYHYPDGTKCDQKGRKLDAAFYYALYSTITKIDEQTLQMVDTTNDQYSETRTLLKMRQKDLVQTEQAIEKLFELYEDGTIAKQRFSDRMAIHSKNKHEAQKDIENYRHLLAANADMVTLDTIQEQVGEFKELWNNASTPSEKNKAYRLLIDRIVYDREDNGVTLEVLYK